MKTDINELAQRMRIAAIMASQGAWSYARSGFNSIVQTSANLPSGGASRVVLCKLFRSEWRGELKTAQDAQFIALANPANVKRLVEALEGAEEKANGLANTLRVVNADNAERAEALEGRNALVALQKIEIRELNVDLEKAQTKAVEQGRTACELFDEVTTLRQRIAELESRLESADKLQDSAFRSGLQHGFSLGQTDDQKGYEQSMAAYSPAAGIKMEAE